MRNQKGFITIDFIFALVLVMGFTGVLFKLMFSLSVASITQYVTFATARNYVAGHVTPQLQEERAILKYNELVSHPVFKPLYSNGWYAIDAKPDIGDISRLIPAYQQSNGDLAQQFWGAAVRFNAKVLDFNIPFFGSTSPETNGSGEGFTATLGSYLGREVSESECLEFVSQRWRVIRSLSSASGGAPYNTGSSESGYMPIADDGC